MAIRVVHMLGSMSCTYVLRTWENGTSSTIRENIKYQWEMLRLSAKTDMDTVYKFKIKSLIETTNKANNHCKAGYYYKKLRP